MRGRIFLAAALLALGACRQEQRGFRDQPPAVVPFGAVQTSDLQAGPKTLDPAMGAYQENRWAVGQGQRLYGNFNCAGCHAPGGGGGMGPPLTDDEWIYGSDPENIFETILQGRPNGMPSFRGKLSNDQIWQLAAYVRQLGGLTPRDTWGSRSDHMQESQPERRPPTQRVYP